MHFILLCRKLYAFDRTQDHIAMTETTDYHSHFDPEVYLKLNYETIGTFEKGDIASFLQKTLHRIFDSGKDLDFIYALKCPT